MFRGLGYTDVINREAHCRKEDRNFPTGTWWSTGRGCFINVRPGKNRNWGNGQNVVKLIHILWKWVFGTYVHWLHILWFFCEFEFSVRSNSSNSEGHFYVWYHKSWKFLTKVIWLRKKHLCDMETPVTSTINLSWANKSYQHYISTLPTCLGRRPYWRPRPERLPTSSRIILLSGYQKPWEWQNLPLTSPKIGHCKCVSTISLKKTPHQ